MTNPWLSLTMNAMQLGIEAQSVVALRIMKVAAGGAAAEREAGRMVTEKIEAALDLQTQIVTGMMTGAAAHRAPARAVALYRRKVRSNRRRLMRGG